MLVKKELLTQDFEGIMKYFRVNIPKKLRSEDHAKYGSLACQMSGFLTISVVTGN